MLVAQYEKQTCSVNSEIATSSIYFLSRCNLHVILSLKQHNTKFFVLFEYSRNCPENRNHIGFKFELCTN